MTMNNITGADSGFGMAVDLKTRISRSLASFPSLIAMKVVVCLLFLTLSWRLWRFTVLPFLHPERPKEFPYWVPFIGHGRAFFLDSNGLISRARKFFGNTKDPFALTAFGKTFYVVTQPKHSAEVYRNTETLSFEEFVQGLMRINGNNEKIIKVIYSALPVDKTGFPNRHGESLGTLAQRMHAHQLHPGDNLVTLQKQVQAWIDQNLKINNPVVYRRAVPTGSGGFTVSLYQWCSETFIQLGQDVYFGETLANIDPELPDAFLAFDELIWKMLYQYPNIMCADMTTPRNQVIASLGRYFEVPKSERRGDIAWLINAMEDEMRAIGVHGYELAVVMFHLYLAINTNTRKTAFWMLAYLIHDRALLETYRSETAAAFGPLGTLVDPFLIQDPARCPTVDAVWHETLRMSGWAASVRLVTADTVVGGRHMRRGHRVVVPHRLMHFDPHIFGARTDQFRPGRWMTAQGYDGGDDDNDEGGGGDGDDGGGGVSSPLARSPSWRPFGGGKTMCSGRFLARFSVTTFVATLLARFDVQPIGNPLFPRPDEGRPVLGTMSVKEGDDFKVTISSRTKSG